MATQVANTILGLWLMLAPAVLGYHGHGAAGLDDRIVGPLAAAFAIVGAWEASRGLRWINVVLGAWLLIAPWLLGFPPEAIVNSSVAGLLMIAFAVASGGVREGFGGGWTALLGHRRPPPTQA